MPILFRTSYFSHDFCNCNNDFLLVIGVYVRIQMRVDRRRRFQIRTKVEAWILMERRVDLLWEDVSNTFN